MLVWVQVPSPASEEMPFNHRIDDWAAFYLKTVTCAQSVQVTVFLSVNGIRNIRRYRHSVLNLSPPPVSRTGSVPEM